MENEWMEEKEFKVVEIDKSFKVQINGTMYICKIYNGISSDYIRIGRVIFGEGFIPFYRKIYNEKIIIDDIKDNGSCFYRSDGVKNQIQRIIDDLSKPKPTSPEIEIKPKPKYKHSDRI